MKFTFGIVNCNRLYYLKSCLESFLICTESYENKEIILVDNASVEYNTEEYLKEKEEQGIKVIRRKSRDPNNEFAHALNTICELSTGDIVMISQGDSQYIMKGNWIEDVVSLYEQTPASQKAMFGSLMYDAQRVSRLEGEFASSVKQETLDNELFCFSSSRYPISGAGEAIYTKDMLQEIYPWRIKNSSHDQSGDSESHMLNKIKHKQKISELPANLQCVAAKIPFSALILTDSRGTNARVRHDKRYGDYWAPIGENYYEILVYEDIKQTCLSMEPGTWHRPLSYEELVIPNGFELPLDAYGNVKKNPIDYRTCREYEVIQ